MRWNRTYRHAAAVQGALACLVLAACSSPNAFKERGDTFGYEGGFFDNTQHGNEGHASFAGDETISPVLLREHCLRRMAEVCFEQGFDYFRITWGQTFDGTAQKPVTTWWGSYRDAYGNVYDRWRTHQEKVATRNRSMRFDAFRGPMPVTPEGGRSGFECARAILRPYHGSRYAGRSLAEPEPPVCAACGSVAAEVLVPEHCPACGAYLFPEVLCPFCHESVAQQWEGLAECGECEQIFRVAACPRCGGVQTLRDCKPFACIFCGRQSEEGVASGESSFRCPHCRFEVGWPEERFGEYECPGCGEVFVVAECPVCFQPHALRAPAPFTCWRCATLCEWDAPPPSRGTRPTTGD